MKEITVARRGSDGASAQNETERQADEQHHIHVQNSGGPAKYYSDEPPDKTASARKNWVTLSRLGRLLGK
jgi:hypothetical protein